MFGMPWGVIEWLLRLICLLIEGVPIEQRRATAVAWFWMWWPLVKGAIKNKDHQAQIESLMNSVKTEEPPK